jgi:phosphoribosylaminoimidazole-succinocarboxamide synthase
MVVRGNLTGHAWRTYQSGLRSLCGVPMPDGLSEYDFFPQPIITPTTKADAGHDEDISREDILTNGWVAEADYLLLEKYTLALFERGKQLAGKQGLILADTKYEFGKIDDTIYLMDEIHTPDSSRYFYADGFEERQARGEKQKQLSKEFVREWLIANNFMGKEGQTVPLMTDEWVEAISQRYIELFEKVVGETFVPQNLNDAEMVEAIETALSKLGNQ